MVFNIDQEFLDEDGFLVEEVAAPYRQRLLQLFVHSEEASVIPHHNSYRRRHCLDFFLRYVFLHRKSKLTDIDASVLREILFRDFPHDLMLDGDDAPFIIRELEAFWIFLAREFQLPNAALCIKALNRRGTVERLAKELSNSSNFGFVKAMKIEAINAGVDLSSESSVNKFFEEFNRQFIAESPYLRDVPLRGAVKAKLGAVAMLIEVFCRRHLTTEYLELCERMAYQVAGLNPCPLAKGGAITWAAGIIYAIGRINNLFDPSQTPYMRAKDICKIFGISQSAGGAKSREILDLLQAAPIDSNWSLPDGVGV
jgi:hypothetical protein